jgi:hypothetical protein
MRSLLGDDSSVRSLLMLLALLGLVLPIAGCGGCNSSPTAQSDDEEDNEAKEKAKKEKEKKKKKPLEDFAFGNILAQPNEVVKDRAPISYVKRGHWVTAAQTMRANNFDVQAELRSLTASNDGTAFDIEHTNYAFLFSRPVPLPKGQARLAESVFFVPRERVDARPPQLRNELVPQRSGSRMHIESTPVSALDEWQYLFVVLSSRPSAFNILEQTQTFSPATDSTFGGDPPIRYYQLLRPAIDKRAPLPSNPLTWSSIAVVLWDDIDPTRIEPPQQQAMLDWLHWGGQLVISGPNSIDRLQGTFLEPYLPATNRRAVNLTQESFNELNEFWSLRERSKPDQPRDLKLVREIAGIELELAPHGQFVPRTGELVAEGRVGQGRIVVTGFSLASGAVQTWPNFDGFLNGALLRRPGRRFVGNTESGVQLGHTTEWADRKLKEYRRDSRLVTRLRYFARDMAFADGDEEQHPYADLRVNTIDPDFGGETQINSTGLHLGPAEREQFGGYLAVPRAGVAAWNDFSGTTNVARRHLNEAAGVQIPRADFVIKVLAAYLAVLVPLNWVLFRSIGRVEWAWVAAPVIAVVGAITVVRLAQLDIGFARSRTEIDVVEFQGGYSRAHVSRFIALYTSLASGYDLAFDDPTSLALPLAINNRYRRGIGETPYQVHLRRDQQFSFTGFQVRSNSTGSIHAEQMYEAGGSLELLGGESEGWQVKNSTDLPLNDVGVFRRGVTGDVYAAYLASLPADSTARLEFRQIVRKKVEQPKPDPTSPVSPGEEGQAKAEENKEQLDIWLDEWDATDVMARVGSSSGATGELRLGRFAELATQKLALRPGDARLVAWSPQEVEGVRYSPNAAQVNGISFVIAHLRRGKWSEAERDANVLQDVSKLQPGDDQGSGQQSNTPFE